MAEPPGGGLGVEAFVCAPWRPEEAKRKHSWWGARFRYPPYHTRIYGARLMKKYVDHYRGHKTLAQVQS